MKYPVIHLNGFLYAVDKEAPLRHKDKYYSPQVGNDGKTHIFEADNSGEDEAYREHFNYQKIIATNDPSLGLPLLSEVRETLKQKQALADSLWEGCDGCDENDKNFWTNGFITGYNHREAKQYSEKDMLKAMSFAIREREKSAKLGRLTLPDTSEQEEQFIKDFMARYNKGKNLLTEFFESLTPKPIAVELEMEPTCTFTRYEGTPVQCPCMDNNYEGKKDCGYMVPKVDEKEFVIVKQWYYE